MRPALTRRSVMIGLALLLLGITFLAIWGWRVFKSVQSLQENLNAAEDLIEGDPLQILQDDPDALTRLLHDVRADVVALERQAGAVARLGPALGWLPKVGPLLADASALLEMADGLTEAGVLLWDASRPAVDALAGNEADMLPQLAAASQMIQPYLPQATAAIQRAQSARAEIEVEALPWRIRGPMQQLDPLLPWLDEGLALADVAPSLLGLDKPRTYLVLALNEDELRPGGGFISGVGEVRLDGGAIVGLTFQDTYAVDDYSQPYPDPPDPLRRFLGVDLWVLRDSNWSPDFPTAARQAIALYRPGYEVDIDGVVAVDQYAVQALVRAVGALTVPGVDQPITGAELLDYIHQAWAPEGGDLDREWWRQRKDFMGTLAQAALARLQSGNVDWQALAQSTLVLLEEKHLLIYVDNAEVAVLLAERGWDGRVQSPQGDYLMLVEANLGYNKASAKIQRHVQYQVDLTQSPPEAELTLVYTHTSTVDYPCTPEIRYDPVYTQMMDRCYWAYLRLYLPAGIDLQSASSHPIPASALYSGEGWAGDALVTPGAEHAVVGQALLLPTSAQTSLTFRYTLPVTVVEHVGDVLRYRLDVQKQPGMLELPLDVQLRLPADAELLSEGRGLMFTDHLVHYTMDLRQDTTLLIGYQVPIER